MRKTTALLHQATSLLEGAEDNRIFPPYELPLGQVWRCVSAQVLPGYGGLICHSFWAIEEEIEDGRDFSEE